MNNHSDRVAKRLGTDQDSPSDSTTSQREKGEKEGSETFAFTAAGVSESGCNDAEESSAPTAGATDRVAGKFTSASGRKARAARTAKEQERRRQAEAAARREDRDQTRNHTVARPVDLGAIVLDEITRDEKRLRGWISKRMERGQDLPATVLRAIELFTARAEAEPVEAATVTEIEAMSTEQLKAFISKLESERDLTAT